MSGNRQLHAGTPWVPAPISQVGDYELDLLKLGFFGWMNAATIATEFWLQQLATMAPVSE
ncbi:MAG: hypothetical protein FGM35_08680 [Rhodocyclaceae bacterium]|jgi:hypothetical protein|nr:hypothetical protein [Rhodocyclaceae bacterium]